MNNSQYINKFQYSVIFKPKNCSNSNIRGVLKKMSNTLEKKTKTETETKTGKYTTLTHCRFCFTELIDIFHLGDNFPLAGGFLKNENQFQEELFYPLSLSFCQKCAVILCKQVIDSDKLFKNGYFYYSSMIPSLVTHFNQYALKLKQLFIEPSNTTTLKVIEIGCNDGVFLRPLKEAGFEVIGVDPSDTPKKLIEEGFQIYNDYLNEQTTQQILEKNGQCDIFLSSNSFAHIDKMDSIFKSIKKLIKPTGDIFIEVHNSKSVFDEMNFDFIYHEHMTYYTISSFYNILKQYQMTIIDAEFTKIHGSSMRLHIKNTDTVPTPDKIKNLMQQEKHLTNINTYLNFTKTINQWKTDITTLYNDLINTNNNNNKKNKIYGYGASGRTNIICVFCDINLEQIIDDAPSKIGSYTPLYHQQIKDITILNTNPPDYILILAWPYTTSIIANIKKNTTYKGKFIIPLPKIEITE